MFGTEGGPHWAPYVTVSMELVNACNFLRNKDIWKRTSPLCSSSNSSPKTCITLPPSHLQCSTGIQYGRLQNGGRQVHPTLWLPPRPNKVTYGCYPSIHHALRFTKGGKGLMPHPVQSLHSKKVQTHTHTLFTKQTRRSGWKYKQTAKILITLHWGVSCNHCCRGKAVSITHPDCYNLTHLICRFAFPKLRESKCSKQRNTNFINNSTLLILFVLFHNY